MPQNALIALRRDTAADWTAADPILENGEPGFETDTGALKIGDGATAWTALPYFTGGGSTLYSSLTGVPTDTFLGRDTAGTGNAEALSVATAKGLLGLTGTNSGDQTITLTGPVTGSGTGSFATSITNGAVTLAKMADVATSTVFYRKTAGTGAPEVQTLATLKTDLGLTGANSGDQTITLTGDVTGSGTGSFAATIANDAVTYAKMQDISAASKLLGRGADSGAGDVQEITLGTNLSMSGTTLNATGGGGGMTDPYVPGDGTMNVTGNIEAVGYVMAKSGTTQAGLLPSSGLVEIEAYNTAGAGSYTPLDIHATVLSFKHEGDTDILVATSTGVAVTGTGSFTGDVTVPDEAYDATAWNG